MNSIGLEETNPRRDKTGHDDDDDRRDFDDSESGRNRNGGEIITTRVFVHSESSDWTGEVSRPFGKSSAVVADMIDQGRIL
jgi:hypothetical protein